MMVAGSWAEDREKSDRSEKEITRRKKLTRLGYKREVEEEGTGVANIIPSFLVRTISKNHW